MNWTDEIIARLKQLWSDGLTPAAIGKQLGISKKAVVDGVYRLDLKRPSPPIKVCQKSELKKSSGLRLRLADMSHRDCRWPSGDPKHENFWFCGRAVMEGKPYCARHCGVAYLPPRERSSNRASRP